MLSSRERTQSKTLVPEGKMVVGLLELSIRIPDSNSLKEKRWVLKSLLARIRNKFNVSVSEVGAHDTWQMAVIGVAHIGNDRRHANEVLDHIVDFAEQIRQIEVLDSKIEFI